ncbi:MAG TPA: sulfatase [Niabella sp.]|nr:sulfatase [Niabella sp.]
MNRGLQAQSSDLSLDDHRPNIVWIVCEDMSPHLSTFGEKTINTPHLDQLARDGIRFTHAYTVAGVCAPSCSALITGMYPTKTGANNMRTLSAPPGPVPDYVPAPYSVVLPPYVKGFPEYLRAAGYYCTNNAKQDYQFQAPVTIWDESSTKAHWRNRPGGKPFFAVFNLGITHEAQIWERAGEPLLVNPSDVQVPPYYPDIPEVRQDIARHLTNVIKMDQQAGAIIQQLKDDGLYDSTIVFFYSDHGDGLPYVKREVLKRGLHIPLIVKLPGKRSAGAVNKELISSLDLPATILSLAGIPVPAYMDGQAFLGAQRSEKMRKYVFAGRDRMDTEVDRVRTLMDTAFQYIRNYMPDKPGYQDALYRLQMPMMKRMKNMRDSGLLNPDAMAWFKTSKPREELYDLKNDPYELKNLANDKRYKRKLEELRAVYNEWYEQTGDRAIVPELQMLTREMWGGEKEPPVTEPPQVIKVDGGILIRCATAGASIGYKINATEADAKGTGGWSLYRYQYIPLKKGDRITIKAQRIGYTESMATFTF